MTIKVDSVKYLKRNPDTILRKSKKNELTSKQRTVLRMRAQGMTMEAVGRYYGVSRKTIDTFLTNIVKAHIEQNKHLVG